MKIYPLSPSTFKGQLYVDPNCQFASHESVKKFGEYVKEKTSPGLDVFIKDMPEGEVKTVPVIKYTSAYKNQRAMDRANAEWIKNGGSAADIPGGYPSFGPGPTRYAASERENLKITYRSPNTSAASGFYLDTEGDSDSDDIFRYLVENLKVNALCDIKR